MGRIKKNDLLKIKFLSNLCISKDNNYLAVSVSQSEKELKEYESNIFIYNVKEDSWNQYTSSGKDNNFFWDNESPILYLNTLRDIKDIEKKKEGFEITTIYQLEMSKGEAIKKITIPKNIKKIRQISKEIFIFSADCSMNSKDFYLLSDEEQEIEIKKKKQTQGYEIIENLPFWENGSGYTHNIITKLYLYDGSSNKVKEISDIIGEDVDIYDFQVNSNLSKAVIIYGHKSSKMSLLNSVAIIDLQNKKVIFNYDKLDYNISNAFLFNDNNLMVCATDMKKYGINENPKFYKINMQSNELECLSSQIDLSIGNTVGTDIRLYSSDTVKMINNKLYFIATQGYSSNLYEIDNKGNIKKITDSIGSVDEFELSKEDFFFIALRNMMPQEVYKFSKNEERISNFNEYVANKRDIIFPNHFTITDLENNTIDYWLLKPYKFKKEKKYPLIVDIHGGPKTVYGEVYYHEMQYWASEGFAVLYCNPRGSDGKGNEFADIRGKYGSVDYENIILCLEEAIKSNEFIDTDRMFVTGGSYGGFMTNWIIGNTNRFKAAATQRSISNWISMYGTTDIGYYFATDQMLSDPWNSYDKMWSHSPMKYYNNIKTPTLIIHSEQDYRCWLVEALQLFTSLKYNNIESKMIIFKNENHELTRSGHPDNRIKNLEEITSWFKNYL